MFLHYELIIHKYGFATYFFITLFDYVRRKLIEKIETFEIDRFLSLEKFTSVHSWSKGIKSSMLLHLYRNFQVNF